ncbi:MAG: response regulator [Anaerolineae bacterium]
MELTSVLIVDDVASVRSEVLAEFETRGIKLLEASGLAELDEYLKHPFEFQMIVLDWLLDDRSSTLAKVCLQKIREKYFVPVMIWTEQLERFTDEAEDVKRDFPEACLTARSKVEVECKDLLDFLKKWYETTPAKLSNQFRQSIAISVEKALYKLAEHSEDDLARGLKTLIATGDISEVDMEHAVDVLLRLVGRVINENETFIAEVRQTVQKLERAPDKAKKVESRIKKLHMYYKPKDDFVRTGDIVKITIGAEMQTEQFKAIVITPACDLAQPGKTTFLRLALIHQKTDKTRKDDRWTLEWDDDQKVGLEVCFHEILVVKNLSLTEAAPKKLAMIYKHSFQTLNGTQVILEREERLDEPYRADLLHHFVSHAGRIGIPDFEAAI